MFNDLKKKYEEMSLIKSMEVVRQNLKEDEDFYNAWKADIADAVYKAYCEYFAAGITPKELTLVGNKAGVKFLKSLIEGE